MKIKVRIEHTFRTNLGFFETTDMNQLFKNTQIGPKCMFNADFNFHKMLIL